MIKSEYMIRNKLPYHKDCIPKAFGEKCHQCGKYALEWVGNGIRYKSYLLQAISKFDLSNPYKNIVANLFTVTAFDVQSVD